MTSDFRVGKSENSPKNWTKKVDQIWSEKEDKYIYVSKMIQKCLTDFMDSGAVHKRRHQFGVWKGLTFS